MVDRGRIIVHRRLKVNNIQDVVPLIPSYPNAIFCSDFDDDDVYLHYESLETDAEYNKRMKKLDAIEERKKKKKELAEEKEKDQLKKLIDKYGIPD